MQYMERTYHHTVTMTEKHFESVRDIMFEWLEKNIRDDPDKDRYLWDFEESGDVIVFYFVRQNDALRFALLWS